MRVAWLAIVTFLGSLLISGGLSNTLAIDSNGRYFALGVGSRSCGDYLKFSEKRLENFTPGAVRNRRQDNRALGSGVFHRAQFLCNGHL